ncbi:conserved hypothetical protein [Candidatus Methylobacter favarea]|uniref:Uncharacterized protein n=1 Tax=Candidatus Methylobacter favarea TaxID=2707345 RepID=A0A8S0XRK7_9GAMM|nr:hypothetical protein [Candidatus Methylobacter favarea]CAA9890069.1 conserved hypothetical protein [Candidatus Methylobacter favarea]
MYYKRHSIKTSLYIFSTVIGIIGFFLALQIGNAKAATFELLKSSSSSRSNAVPLANASVAGNIYAFVSPETGISKVSFYLNNLMMGGGPRQVENFGPWDFAGGSTTAANPSNTHAFANGSNTISARITLTSGGTQVINTPFTVNNGTTTPVPSSDWGTYLKPFAANSPWNSRPVAPVFGQFVIPTSSYFPSVAEGAYSTGIFLSTATDAAVTVKGLPGTKGLWNPDDETYHDVKIPRWPSIVKAATGNDGHADIVDPVSGIMHSFWQLKYQDGQWVAAQYAWSRIDGRGWGDPAHYFQGARAAGVPTGAGLMRKHEIADDDVLYRHALAMSLTYNGLSPKPAYIFPATAADSSASQNTGIVPEGALMMLPTSFNTQQISSLALRKVAETLKVYGAYVVDRNYGTPFVIYVENGSGFNLHNGGWDTKVASELDLIRKSLRQVVAVSGWLDGNGQTSSLSRNFNLLSMRGPWQLQWGSTVAGVYDSWAQAVVFPKTLTPSVQVNWNVGVNRVYWAIPNAGTAYQLTAQTQGGGKLRLKVLDKDKKTAYDSGELENGETVAFDWPAQSANVVVYAISGVGESSLVRGKLIKLEQ